MSSDARAVITLTPEPARVARNIAASAGISLPEAIRRGLSLLDLVAGLSPDEEIVIRNRKTRDTERVVFQWRS